MFSSSCSENSTGPDDDISTSALIAGAANLSNTITRLEATQTFKIISLGDSVTAGVQIDRGNAFASNLYQAIYIHATIPDFQI